MPTITYPDFSQARALSALNMAAAALTSRAQSSKSSEHRQPITRPRKSPHERDSPSRCVRNAECSFRNARRFARRSTQYPRERLKRREHTESQKKTERNGKKYRSREKKARKRERERCISERRRERGSRKSQDGGTKVKIDGTWSRRARGLPSSDKRIVRGLLYFLLTRCAKFSEHGRPSHHHLPSSCSSFTFTTFSSSCFSRYGTSYTAQHNHEARREPRADTFSGHCCTGDLPDRSSAIDCFFSHTRAVRDRAPLWRRVRLSV